MCGVSKIIAILEEEIKIFDNAADEFPNNDETYVRLENELDKLEKILIYAKKLI